MCTDKAFRGRGEPYEDLSIELSCPILELTPGELIAPALNNYDAIRAVYEPADLFRTDRRITLRSGRIINPEDSWGTPTPETIDAMTQRVQENPSGFPEIFILATDGQPRMANTEQRKTLSTRFLGQQLLSSERLKPDRTQLASAFALMTASAETHAKYD